MFGNTFYHGSARKLIVAFGSVFNNIHVQRKDDNGTLIKDIKVPLAYESQKKYMAKLIKDPKKTRSVPRMGFIMDGLAIDMSRASNQMNQWKIADATDGNSNHTMYSPVPYDYTFTLDIYVDYMDDGLQIIEQILPYFQPDFNVVLEELPMFDVERDIPIELLGVNMTDEFEGEFGEHRIVNWTLEFVMKGWMYPPITQQGLIKQIVAEYKVAGEDGDFNLVDSPVLEQTTLTVDPFDANKDDDWSVVETTTSV